CLEIERPESINNDSSAEVDVRVVKVKIKLDPTDSDRVKALNNLQVRVSIKT
ncbi:MAG: HlyD family secretion protein, partial [Cyanothece sp. SIO2G6]|nr:HlyD family secretion protein [Cyanothece sp. SIO2G6]